MNTYMLIHAKIGTEEGEVVSVFEADDDETAATVASIIRSKNEPADGVELLVARLIQSFE